MRGALREGHQSEQDSLLVGVELAYEKRALDKDRVNGLFGYRQGSMREGTGAWLRGHYTGETHDRYRHDFAAGKRSQRLGCRADLSPRTHRWPSCTISLMVSMVERQGKQ